MNNKTILILGNANSPFVIYFTKWILKFRPNYCIDIINTTDKICTSDAYNAVINTFPKNHFKNTSIITKIKTRLIIRQKINAIPKNKYDVIILHYVYPWYAPLSNNLKSKTKKLIAVFWGSDLNRISKTKKKRLEKLFYKTDAIILGSPFLFDKIKNEFPNFKSKYTMCYFGCEPIEEIKKFKENNISKASCKTKLNIDTTKTTIVLGYNGGKAQQHLKIITNLINSKVLKKHKDNIHFIFPLTYSLNNIYFEELKNLLNNFNYEYSIFTEFLNKEDSATLRLATDIFVNLQVTDSFNGTLRESFYSDTIVINGSWLPYQTLKELGLYYHEINDIKKLSENLTYCLENFTLEKEKSIVNTKIIYDISSWSKTIFSWLHTIDN